MLHPFNGFSVELFLDSDVRHACTRRSSVPVLFTGRKPDNIAGTDLLDRASFALRPSKTRCNDESLSQRMCMPCGPRTRFERHTCALNQRGLRRLEERIDAYAPSEPLRRSFCGRLRANSFDFHVSLSVGSFLENIFCDRKRREDVRPPGIERQLCDDLCCLRLCKSVVHRPVEVVRNLCCLAIGNESANRHQTSVS